MASISTLPESHHRPAAQARRRWQAEVDDDTPAWPFTSRGRPVVLALAAQNLIYLPDTRSGDFVVAYRNVTATAHGASVTVAGRDWEVTLDAPGAAAASEFLAALQGHQAQHGAPRAPAAAPPSATDRVLIVTTNEVPGYEVVAVHGDVFGLIVRARNIFSNMGASLRTVVGGEVSGYTKLLSESRNDARERLAEEALRRGANAVIAMRFDCNEIADVMSEVAAYGTAVTIQPAQPSRASEQGAHSTGVR